MKSLKTLCFMAVLAVGLFSLWGCPKKAEVAAAPGEQTETGPAVQGEEKEEQPEAAVTEETKAERAPEAAGRTPI